MICAYDRIYLEAGRRNLARMLDFAVYDMHYELQQFYNWFLISGIAEQFGEGDYRFLAGMSGVELTYEVLDALQIAYERQKPCYSVDRSEEYWTGWALAYYQWETSLTFREIEKYIPITEVCSLYSPYHEMDICQFSDKMNELYRNAKKGTSLKILRKYAGMSQRELSELSGVPLRTIQQYEQQQKNINKAQVEYLVRLSQTLCCEITDLLEKTK